MNKMVTIFISIFIGGLVGWFAHSWYSPNFLGDSDVTKSRTLKIGVIASLTGKGADRGESALQGLELAKRIIESKILPGTKIQLIYEDVPLDAAKKAPTAFLKLVEVDKVSAIIGPMGSNVALAVTPLVDEKGIPVIVHTASALNITEGNDYVFRLWPTANQYASAIKDRLENFSYKKIAIFSAVNDNTIDLLNILKQDVNFVIDEQVASDIKDFRTQLAKIKQASPDALFINLFEGQIGIAAKQARELGLDVPIFTNSVMSNVELETGPEYLEGAWFTRFSGYEDVAKDEFIEMYGKEPSNPETAAAAHDALISLATAVSAVGADSEKIKDYLYKNTFVGVMGEFRFTQSGDAKVPLSIKTVKNGEIVEVEKVR